MPIAMPTAEELAALNRDISGDDVNVLDADALERAVEGPNAIDAAGAEEFPTFGEKLAEFIDRIVNAQVFESDDRETAIQAVQIICGLNGFETPARIEVEGLVDQIAEGVGGADFARVQEALDELGHNAIMNDAPDPRPRAAGPGGAVEPGAGGDRGGGDGPGGVIIVPDAGQPDDGRGDLGGGER